MRIAGAFHTCVCKDGKAYMWGKADESFVMLKLPTDGDIPKEIEGIENVKMTSVGDLHFSLLTTDGKVYSWGKGTFFRLGSDKVENRQTPAIVDTLGEQRFRDLDNGAFHSSAISISGELYLWGHNGAGQLGNGNFTHTATPHLVKLDDEGKLRVQSVSCGSFHTLAVDTSGGLWAWGINSDLQLGVEGSDEYFNKPTKCKRVEDWLSNTKGFENDKVVKVSAGESISLAVTSMGKVLKWGDGSDAVEVVEGFGKKEEIVDLDCGVDHFVAISKKGSVYCWGNNEAGQCGDPSSSTMFLKEPALMKFFEEMKTEETRIIGVSAGAEHSVAHSVDGIWYSWGNPELGRLGRKRGGEDDEIVGKVSL